MPSCASIRRWPSRSDWTIVASASNCAHERGTHARALTKWQLGGTGRFGGHQALPVRSGARAPNSLSARRSHT
eukprot:7211566-Prymnesium_polylepis.1